MCHTVPRPVQPSNMSYGTTTSVFHLAMCYAVPRPVQPSNVSCGTTTSVFHMAMCYTVPQPVPFTWQCVMWYHGQCNLAICHTVSQPVYFSWQCVIRYHDQCNLAICHTVPQSVYFTWQSGNVSYGTTTSASHMAQRLKVRLQVLTWCTFSVTWESSVIFSGYSIWKTTLNICFKWQFVRENVIGANRRHFYQVVSV